MNTGDSKLLPSVCVDGRSSTIGNGIDTDKHVSCFRPSFLPMKSFTPSLLLFLPPFRSVSCRACECSCSSDDGTRVDILEAIAGCSGPANLTKNSGT